MGAVGGLASFGQCLPNDQTLAWLPMQNYQMIQASAKIVCDETIKIGLSVSLTTATTLRSVIENETEPYTGPPQSVYKDMVQFGVLAKQRLKRFSEDLALRVNDELGARTVLIIPVENAPYYKPAIPIFGKEITDKFPNQTEDMFEVGNCFATGRYTACVFHSMRIMEIAVQAFGSKLGVTFTDQKVWQTILNELNPVIKGMDHKLAITKQYAAIHSHLYSVKVAWRNEVMHPKATYDEDEAREIMDATKSFLSQLIKIV